MQPNQLPSQYLVVEGLEGAGKSHAVAVLAEYLESQGIPYHIVREPGGTKVAEEIRGILKHTEEELTPYTELLLFVAARAQVYALEVAPRLAEGTWVISDRSALTTHAYQMYGRKLADQIPFPVFSQMHCRAVGRRYDHVFLLDIDPVLGLQRAQNRGALDRIEQSAAEFFERARQGYHHAMTYSGAVRGGSIIDASAPLDQVRQELLTSMENFVCRLSSQVSSQR